MIEGTVNYLASSAEPSLYRNGRVLTRRDRDGSDSGSAGIVVQTAPISIADARAGEGGMHPTCESNGFELVAGAAADPALDFYAHGAVVSRYYPECAELVQARTGAAFVAAFDHNVRSAVGKADRRRIAGGQEVQGPAHMVHGDYTLTSAPQRLEDLSRPPSGNDTLRELLDGRPLVPPELAAPALAGDKRFAIINVWRSIGAEPVETDALALCDGRSVEPEDLVVFEIHYQDRIGENYFARPSTRHRWHTYPGMTGEEALLIKQWDSAGPLAQSLGRTGDGEGSDAPCTFSFHTAYQASSRPDAPARESVEVRCVAIYE